MARLLLLFDFERQRQRCWVPPDDARPLRLAFG